MFMYVIKSILYNKTAFCYVLYIVHNVFTNTRDLVCIYVHVIALKIVISCVLKL